MSLITFSCTPSYSHTASSALQHPKGFAPLPSTPPLCPVNPTPPCLNHPSLSLAVPSKTGCSADSSKPMSLLVLCMQQCVGLLHGTTAVPADMQWKPMPCAENQSINHEMTRSSSCSGLTGAVLSSYFAFRFLIYSAAAACLSNVRMRMRVHGVLPQGIAAGQACSGTVCFGAHMRHTLTVHAQSL
jgi:hypothetical protein